MSTGLNGTIGPPGNGEPSREAAVHNSLGLLLDSKGDPAAAVECFAAAALADPLSWEAWYNLGAVSHRLGNVRKAEASFRTAIDIKPDLVDAHAALGIVLQEQGMAGQAAGCYRRALELKPDLVQAWYNLGIVLKETGNFSEALEACRATVRLQPDHADAHWNLALLLLLTGDFSGGWKEFVWRTRKSGMRSGRIFPQPSWDGSPLQGSTILLHAEQGCGDTIQFVRYAPLVAARGGTVVLECQAKGLKRLLSTVDGVSQVIERGEPLPEYSVHAPLMDLPAIFGTNAGNIPASVPYLQPDPHLAKEWRDRLPTDSSLLVGIVWAGNKGHENDSNRSFPAALFSGLSELPGVALVSLQMGDESLAGAGVSAGLEKIVDLTGFIDDFVDTAACIVNLDLVITVDTAVAHLAGALGIKVWTLIPFAPDWRWLLDREDSPWYPSMRLFRQQKPGEWGDVLLRVRDALHDFTLNNVLRLHGIGASAKALELCRRVLAMDGNCAKMHRIYGYICHDLGLVEQAVEEYSHAIDLQGEDADTANELGVALRALERTDEAAAAYRRALSLDPLHLIAAVNLGAAYQSMGRPSDAIAAYRQALSIDPQSLEAYINLGSAFLDMGMMDEVISVNQQILQQLPDQAEAHWNMALALLAKGDLLRGWQEYEWRWKKLIDPTPPRDFPQPSWEGNAPDGRTILVHAEQGLGDTFQFIRYASLIAKMGGTVVVECQDQGLKPVIETVPGISRVVVRGEPLPPFDLHVPLMSLPRLFNTSLATIPAEVPYIFPSSDKVSAFRKLVGNESSFKVGLVWGGNQSGPKYRRRSCSLRMLNPLGNIPGVALYSLQKGDPAREAVQPPQGMDLMDLSANIDDFADTAALIATMDLVISVDTSVAHLAGAMGKPVWTLLTSVADWRWLLDREDTPWYPSMRLFRQERTGGWTAVIRRVAAELQFLQKIQ